MPPSDDPVPARLPATDWPSEGPWTRLVMLRALDGGVAGADLRSRSISNATDRGLLGRTRDFAGGIIVGAGTMRVEPYGPPTVTEEVAAERVGRGMPPAPRLVIVTRTLDLPWEEPALSDQRPGLGPVIVTGKDAPADRLARAGERAEVLRLARLSASAILDALHSIGLVRLSLEGGPTLVREFLAADVVDEMFVTLAPYAATWTPPMREPAGPPATPVRLSLVEVASVDSYLYARYVRARDDLPLDETRRAS